jgi:hypothetical protein
MSQRPQLFGKTLFVDLMMSTLVVITALLMASNAVEKNKKIVQEAGLATEGKFAIIMDWPNGSEDDVDLYVRDPRGNVAFFQGRDTGLMHLEHDDRGTRGDKLDSNGKMIAVDKNEERTIIRGIIPGEYTVNVHMFSKHGRGDVPVTVRLVRLKGMDADVIRKERVLSRSGQQATAFRFTLEEDGSVTNVNELPAALVGEGGR